MNQRHGYNQSVQMDMCTNVYKWIYKRKASRFLNKGSNLFFSPYSPSTYLQQKAALLFPLKDENKPLLFSPP